MRHEQRIERFFFDEFLEHMLRHLEVCELRQNFELELVHSALAPLLGRELKPILAGNFADDIEVAHAAPWSFQIDRADDFPVSVSMLDAEGAAVFLGEMTDHFFNT